LHVLETMQTTRLPQEQRISGRHRKSGRTVVGVAAVLAVFGAQLVGGTGGPTAAASVGRMKPQSGLYKGKTAEGASVSFEVKKGRVMRPGFIVFRRGCFVKITFTGARNMNGKGGFFFGRRSSDFLGGKFATRRIVRGKAGVDLSHSSCPGRGVHEMRFRARRVRPLR
jgi:hypothetical protein